MWLSGLSAGLQTRRPLVRFPVRAHAWVAGQVLRWGCARSSRSVTFLSHVDVSLPLSPSLPLSLKINKYNFLKYSGFVCWKLQNADEKTRRSKYTKRDTMFMSPNAVTMETG